MTVRVQERGKAGTGVGSFRWLLIFIVMLVTTVSAMDRSNLSVLIVDRDFLETMGIVGNTTAQGALVTFYLLPYALFNMLVGPLIDRFGARRATTFLVVSVAAITAFAGSVSQYALFAGTRLARAVVESPLFPMSTRYAKNWFPPRERGTANAIWLMGTPVGQAFGIVLSTLIISTLGWRWTLWGIAGCGWFIALPLVLVLVHDHPRQSRLVSEAEREFIMSQQARELAVGARSGHVVSDRRFLKNYRFWLVTTFHVASLATNWGMLAWMPKYFAEARGLNLAAMGVSTTAAYVLGAATTFGAGYLSDRLRQRAPISCTTMALSGLVVVGAAFVPDAAASAVLMVVAFSLRGIGSPNLFALLQRIIPQSQIAAGSGIDNGCANLGSAFVPTLIGFLIGVTGAYSMGLMVIVGIAFVGATAMAVLWVQGY